MKTIKKLCYAVLIAACIPALHYVFLLFNYKNDIHSTTDKIPAAFTAIVFGAGLKKDGTPSTILADRVAGAVALFKANKATTFLLSGDNHTTTHDEPEAMKKILMDNGVPVDKIFLDYAGFDTYSTLYRAKTVFKATDVILVSQKYHLTRALYIANNLGIKATGFSTNKRLYKGRKWYFFREIFATAKASLDCLRGRKPRYLGDVIDVHGNSNAMEKENFKAK